MQFNEYTLGRIEKITLQTTIAGVWVSACMVWFILGWFENSYRHFGAELPTLTALFLQGVWQYLPFILAFLLSVLLLYQLYRPHAQALLYALWGLAVWAVYLLIILLAVGLPFYPPCAVIE